MATSTDSMYATESRSGGFIPSHAAWSSARTPGTDRSPARTAGAGFRSTISAASYSSRSARRGPTWSASGGWATISSATACSPSTRSSGKRLWHFQDVRHDIWDLDVCAPPNLVTIVRDGKRVDVVTCMAKSGHLFVLDRVSGKPIFPVRLAARAGVETSRRTDRALSAGSGNARADFPQRIQSGRHHRSHAGGARVCPEGGGALELRIFRAVHGRKADAVHRIARRRGMVGCGGRCADRPALCDVESLGVEDHGDCERRA